MKLIDTHAHLYLQDFKPDLSGIMERATASGVEKIFLPAIDSKHHEEMIHMEATFPGRCFAMIGLHPCSVHADYKEELKLVENLLNTRPFSAIGEVGLDFYW